MIGDLPETEKNIIRNCVVMAEFSWKILGNMFNTKLKTKQLKS